MTVVPPGHRIYFIKPIDMDGPIKIGCSRWPIERLDELHRWSPVPLQIVHEMPGSFVIERAIHRALRDALSHKEWFYPTPRVLQFVSDLQSGVPLHMAMALKVGRGRWKGRPLQHSTKVEGHA